MYTPEKKVGHLRRHLQKVPVSDICEELGNRPTLFHSWQRQLFEHGAAAFERKGASTTGGNRVVNYVHSCRWKTGLW